MLTGQKNTLLSPLVYVLSLFTEFHISVLKILSFLDGLTVSQWDSPLRLGQESAYQHGYYREVAFRTLNTPR